MSRHPFKVIADILHRRIPEYSRARGGSWHTSPVQTRGSHARGGSWPRPLTRRGFNLGRGSSWPRPSSREGRLLALAPSPTILMPPGRGSCPRPGLAKYTDATAGGAPGGRQPPNLLALHTFCSSRVLPRARGRETAAEPPCSHILFFARSLFLLAQ